MSGPEGSVRAKSFALLLLILVPGLADAHAPGDPFEKLNRRGFAVQAVLERYAIGPLAMVWKALTPGPIGRAIHHVIVNVGEPLVIINDMLQLRPRRASRALARFSLNSTIGLGGMIDVGAKAGLPHHLSSFGDTLGRYGVRSGPYLFIPLIGPTDFRDLFGNGVDATIDPVHFARYPHRNWVSISLALASGFDQFSRAQGDLKALLSDAADPYATLRSTWLQNRAAEIAGDNASALPALPDLGPAEVAPEAASPPATPSGSDSAAPLTAPGEQQAPPLQPLPQKKDGDAHSGVARPLQ
jgi:phospholipid-binding lipoprotein MlaA